MKSHIEKLASLSSKNERMIVGLMSGTSLDGLDVALCKFIGTGTQTKLRLMQFATIPYSAEIKQRIRKVFAKAQVDFNTLSSLHPWIGTLHGKMVLQCLKQWRVSPRRIDAIASHGQTVFHAPASRQAKAAVSSTFQVGDGDHVAQVTGIITISDFRQKHIAAGGEGAPLAVYGDYLLLANKSESRILLNLGGVANFTYLPAGLNAHKVFVTDTGPGNTLIDSATRHLFSRKYFDRDAKIAYSGTVNQKLLNALMADPFFAQPFPKTTGPELFNWEYLVNAQKRSRSKALSPQDTIATLTRFSADTICQAIERATNKQRFQIYVSGGGAHNPLLMSWIKEKLSLKSLRSTDELGISGDAKEAILFAVLANETLAGKPVNFGNRSKIPSITMGKISLPS